MIPSAWVKLDGFIAGPNGETDWVGAFFDEAERSNSRLMREVVPGEVQRVKQAPGRDMVIYGSAGVVRTFTNLGLVDEYQLLFHPVVLGSGKPLLKDIEHRVVLKLSETRTHPSGVVVLRYERDGGGQGEAR